MKSRLINPLLAAAVGGALVAGIAGYAGPAFAASPGGPVLTGLGATTPQPSPTTKPTTTPQPSPSSVEPSVTSPPVDPTPGDSSTPGDPTPSDADPSNDPSDPSDPSDSPSPGDPGTSTSPTDTVAPTGAFKLNLTSLWQGQKVTLTQGPVSDDVSSPDEITRIVTWGDGSRSSLTAGQAPIAKTYAKPGKYTVTFTVGDAAGNTSSKKATVSVTTPGKFKLSKTSVWHGQTFTVTVSAVPSGTSKIVFYYADGSSYTAKGKNQTLPAKKYYHLSNGQAVPSGTKTLTAKFTNKNGTSNSITVGKVTLKKDSWNPTVKVTKPKNASKVSSWSTLRGTAADKGSGIHDVLVVAVRGDNSGNIFCYTNKKKWMKLLPSTNVASCGNSVKVAKGKWSLKVNGLKKGYLVVIASAADWASRMSKDSQVEATLKK